MPHARARRIHRLPAKLGAAVVWFAWALPGAGQEVDWEAALATFQEARVGADDIAMWARRNAPTAEDARRRWDSLAQRNPFSPEAAAAEATRCVALFDEGRWEEVVDAVPVVVARHPGFPGKMWKAVSLLGRVAARPNVPEAIQLRAVRALVPLCRHRPSAVRACGNALRGAGLSDMERYRLGLALEEGCGESPAMREFRWRLIETLSRTADPGTIRTECDRFRERYPAETAEAHAIERLLLTFDATPDGRKRLATFVRDDADRAAAVARAAAAVTDSLAAGDPGAVKAAAEALAAARWAAEPAWVELVQGRAFAGATVEVKLALLESLYAHTSPGVAQQAAAAAILSHVPGSPAALRLAFHHFAANADDVQQAVPHAGLLVRYARECGEDSVASEAFKAMAAAMEKLGLVDLAVEHLTEYGMQTWDVAHAPAVDALRQAASQWPAVPSAAQAGWLLTFLEGRNGVVQSALPRPHVVHAGADERPPASTAPAAHPEPVEFVVRDNAVAPAALDATRNLLAGRPAFVAGGGPPLDIVTDGKDDTAWRPARLPTAVVVPVGRTASINRVRVRLTSPASYTVSLLDAEGDVVCRVERDWGFWEHHRSAKLWPAVAEMLHVAPVGDVAALEVRVFNAIGGAGIAEIEAYPPPFPATALHAFPPQDVEPDAQRVAVVWEAEEPQAVTMIHADRESTRGYPIMRWLEPWTRSARPVALRAIGDHIGIEFWGDAATATISGAGGVRWRVDDGGVGESEPVTDAVARDLAIGPLAPGRHLLQLETTVIPAAKNAGGWSGIRFDTLAVTGRARVRPLIRFVTADGVAGPWLEPGGDGSVRVPERQPGAAPPKAQAAAVFDSRGVAATTTATVRGMRLRFDAAPGEPGAPLVARSHAALPEDLDAAVAAVAAREAVVAFPKTGSSIEHDAARDLAEAAGLYLVPDDIGLNRYSSPVIAVGTPLRHRYCRQLLATKGLWNDPAYLNAAEGLVLVETDMHGRVETIHVTGESPEAVAKAAGRLASALPKRPAPRHPCRVFAAHTLETIYPWQLHPGRKPPERIEIRLGKNDRRSAQIGIAAEQRLDGARVECGELVSEEGDSLPPLLVRPVGNYEWVPFFGDLRLPNLLLPERVVTLPAHATQGVWLTATTRPDTRPGTYLGTVTVSAGTQRESIPVRVLVEPISLPESPRAATYSFAAVPYWFHQGSEPWRRALKELARNEAEHGVNTVSPVMRFVCRTGSRRVPAEFAVGDAASGVDSLRWAPFSSAPKSAAKGQAVFVRFAEPLVCRELAAVVEPSEETGFALACAAADGGWHAASEPTRRLQATWAARKGPRTPAGPEAVRMRATAAADSAVWRITATDQGGFSVHGVIAMAVGDARWPFTVDFSRLAEQMDVYDAAYRECGRALPTFLCQMDTRPFGRLLAELFGPGSQREGDVAAWFAEQLAEHLRTTGRAERFILKAGDEPWDLVRWAQSARPFKDGGLRVMTCHNTSYPDMGVGTGLLEPWCPNYEHEVWKPFLRERQAHGDKVWWYECGEPATRITGTPIDNLPFYWLTAKWRLDGALNYAALHATKGSSMPVPFRYEHGMDHRVVIERDGRLLDTPRRELEADGIRDLALLEWVREGIASLEAAAPAQAVALSARLDAAVESVVPYRIGYPQDPATWFEARDTLYDIAHELAR